MSLVASLPGRPLTDGEVAALNRADSVELAVAVDSDTDSQTADRNAAADGTGAEGLLLATDSWVKGLDFLGGAWEVVETVHIDGEEERYDALRVCEDAVRDNDAD